MNIHYLVDTQGQTDSVIIPLALWQQILETLKKSPESTALLMEIPQCLPQFKQVSHQIPQNPLKDLLESNFIGCFEAEPDLSVNYKTELGKLLDAKSNHR